MVRIYSTLLLLLSFPVLIFGESVVGLPLMSIFLFLLLTLRLSLLKRVWWLLYITGWLAWWYHTWWWQTIVVLSILLLWTKLVSHHKWIFGWLILHSLVGSIVFSVLFVQLSTRSEAMLVVLQIIGSSLCWWWLWRHWGVWQRSSTWYIR